MRPKHLLLLCERPWPDTCLALSHCLHPHSWARVRTPRWKFPLLLFVVSLVAWKLCGDFSHESIFFFLQQCFKHPFFSNLYSSLYPQQFLDDLTSYFIKEVDPISRELLQFLTWNFSLSCTHLLHLLSCYREGIPCSHAGPSLCVCSESHSFPPSQGPFSVSCLF